MAEWTIALHWKCSVPHGTAGSNPALSATIFVPLDLQAKRVLLSVEKSVSSPKPIYLGIVLAFSRESRRLYCLLK